MPSLLHAGWVVTQPTCRVVAVLTVFLTHDPEDLDAYYARTLPQLQAIARVVLNPPDVALTSDGIEQCDLPALLRRSDFVLPLAAATASTEKLIDAATLDSGRLARRPGVIATPHLGGLTPENADAQATSSVEQVRAILAGIMPPRAVNPEQAGRLRAWWRDHHFIEESS